MDACSFAQECHCSVQEQCQCQRCLQGWRPHRRRMTPPLASGACVHQRCRLDTLLRPPKASNTTFRSSDTSVRALVEFKSAERHSKRRGSPKSRVSPCFAESARCQVSARRQVVAGRSVKVSCCLCTSPCTAQDCGLTLPSRGQLPGYALQLPLMSNVRPLHFAFR